MIESEL